MNLSNLAASRPASYQLPRSGQKIFAIGISEGSPSKDPAGTTHIPLAFEVYGTPEPHSVQKALLSARSGKSKRFTCASPESHFRFSGIENRFDACAEPVAF